MKKRIAIVTDEMAMWMTSVPASPEIEPGYRLHAWTIDLDGRPICDRHRRDVGDVNGVGARRPRDRPGKGRRVFSLQDPCRPGGCHGLRAGRSPQLGSSPRGCRSRRAAPHSRSERASATTVSRWGARHRARLSGCSASKWTRYEAPRSNEFFWIQSGFRGGDLRSARQWSAKRFYDPYPLSSSTGRSKALVVRVP